MRCIWLLLLIGLWADPSPAAALTQSPAPSPAPASDPTAERARWRARLAWPERCETDHRAAVAALALADARLEVHDLGGGRRLIVVGCTRGAYQSSARYYVVDESVEPARSVPLLVPTWELDDEEIWQPREVEELAAETSFDTRARVLTLLTRSRGLGDCGLRVRYRVQKERLSVLEARGRVCDGDPEQAAPPERWPLLPVGQVTPAPAPARP
jgi:hypothetical protein